MQSFEIVVSQELLVLDVEVDLIFWFAHLEKEELLLVSAKGALDDGVLVRTRFVYMVVFELHFIAYERVESLLELQAVVRLDEITLERELRDEEPHCLDRECLIKVRKDDALLVPRIYVHDGVQKKRVGKP